MTEITEIPVASHRGLRSRLRAEKTPSRVPAVPAAERPDARFPLAIDLGGCANKSPFTSPPAPPAPSRTEPILPPMPPTPPVSRLTS